MGYQSKAISFDSFELVNPLLIFIFQALNVELARLCEYFRICVNPVAFYVPKKFLIIFMC